MTRRLALHVTADASQMPIGIGDAFGRTKGTSLRSEGLNGLWPENASRGIPGRRARMTSVRADGAVGEQAMPAKVGEGLERVAAEGKAYRLYLWKCRVSSTCRRQVRQQRKDSSFVGTASAVPTVSSRKGQRPLLWSLPPSCSSSHSTWSCLVALRL